MNNVYLPNSTIILFVGIKRRIETKEIHPITAKGINTHLEPYLLRCISIPFSSPNEPQTIAINKYKAPLKYTSEEIRRELTEHINEFNRKHRK